VPLYRSGLGVCRPHYSEYGPLSTYKDYRFSAGVIRINPQVSDQLQGGSFASRQERAFDSASLSENLQNPARVRVAAGPERRVTTAFRTGSDAGTSLIPAAISVPVP